MPLPSVAPPHGGEAPFASEPGFQPAATVAKRVKPREDTGAGCDALAASDLARAAIADTENGRRKFERSAGNWQQRAELLREIETGLARRAAKNRAMNNGSKAPGAAIPPAIHGDCNAGAA